MAENGKLAECTDGVIHEVTGAFTENPVCLKCGKVFDETTPYAAIHSDPDR